MKDSYSVTLVNCGNPHCVIFVENVDSIDAAKIGKDLQNQTNFFPNSANIEFAEIVGPYEI